MEGESSLADLFTEPERPPSPEASVVEFERANGQLVHVRLVGKHPLWGHILYPSSKQLAGLIESQPELVRDKCVVELGAGGGLPGMIAALEGARVTVISDFNDLDLVDNLRRNIEANCSSVAGTAHAVGYTWSANATPLLAHLPANQAHFDVVLLADLVFNNSQHENLLRACESCLQGKGFALCYYGLHRPKKAEADQAIFAKAEARGWQCEQIWKDETAGAVFPGDEGDLLMRSTVFGWKMTSPLHPVEPRTP